MRMRTLFAMVCLLGLAALSAQAYRLQFKDPQGAVRSYKTTMHMQGSTDVMGMTLPVDSSVAMTSTEKVLSKNANGTSTIAYNVKEGRVTATVTVPGEEEDQKVDQALPAFGMTYSRLPNGKVTNLKTTGAIDPELQKQLDAMNGQMQYPGQGLQFPDRDVKIGDSWDGTQSFTLGAGATMNFKVKYTLAGTKEVNGKTYLVLNSDIDAKAKDLTMNVSPGAGVGAVKLKVSMVITGTNTVLFDYQAGEMSDTTFNMNVDMTMTSADMEGMDIKMKMTMDGSMIRQ